MFIIKNAFRCIGRSKGRNILIGIIVLAISVAACIGLSIQQASRDAEETALEGMSVTATISYDRQSAMKDMMPEGEFDPSSMPDMSGGFDRSQFSDMMGESSSLTLEEYQTYAEAESVDDFYFTYTVSLNGSDSFLPVSDEEESEESQETEESTEETDTEGTSNPFGGGFGGGMMFPGGNMMMGSMSDFSVVGYSSYNAMTSFLADGTATMVEGDMFEEGSSAYECIITEELAIYNNISLEDDTVDTILLTNPNNEEESYEFTVVGIYSDTSGNAMDFSSMMGATSLDPANQIYTSYEALSDVVKYSEENSATMTDENTGREYETELNVTLEATYSFKDVESYEAFESEARELGLSDEYVISSSDISSYENSLTPLKTLSDTMGWMLIVILGIGAVVLIVFNIFNVRERKYEIGVLTAMGMKKGKVALQFLCEIFTVTIIAVMIGAVIGGVCSVPVTNSLLENQDIQTEERFDIEEMNFGGRGGMSFPGMPGGMDEEQAPEGFMENAQNYISEIDSAMNLTVVWQMLAIAVGLTLVAGAVSMLFVMRYDPLKILANRD